MVTAVKNTSLQFQTTEPSAGAIQKLTAEIRRRWSPEERLLRLLWARNRQQLLGMRNTA